MKKWQALLTVLFCTAVLFSAGDLGAEIKLYDDFSSGYIDGTKWRQREYVREIVDGEFVFKLGNRSPGMGAEVVPGQFRNNLTFLNSDTINSIACDVIIEEARSDSAPDSKSFIRVGGYFYNKNDSGGATGDIFAQIMIGDQGNGSVEAFWEVQEMLSDDASTWDVLGGGTIIDLDDAHISPPYQVKLSYDGNKTFTFSVNDDHSANYNGGPDRMRDAVTSWKGISAGINAMNGSNDGYIHGTIDNVFINGSTPVYDNFSDPFIDLSRWSGSEWVREASSGFLRANSLGYGSTDRTTTHLSYRSAPYLEAKARIDSTSQLSTGAVGVSRIQGYYYNDRRGPGSGEDYNQYEGDVFVQVRLRYDSDDTLGAYALVDRSDDANESVFTRLFTHQFDVPISLDAFYPLSIRYEGSQLIFGCAGETATYDIKTPMYPAYGMHRHLRSVIFLDPEEAGYINASFDDVYVETCPCDLQPFDGDVDGSDLAAYIADDAGISLSAFADDFGNMDCP